MEKFTQNFRLDLNLSTLCKHFRYGGTERDVLGLPKDSERGSTISRSLSNSGWNYVM
jgi:hypothetical protein